MTYAVDFDGTLCADRFPEIGEPKAAVIRAKYNNNCRKVNADYYIDDRNFPLTWKREG